MSVHHPHTEEEYNQLRSGTKGLVIVDFSATWCGPCRAIAPHFESLAKSNNDVVFIHVDIDELGSISDASDVRGVPTFKFFKEGELKHEFSGANQKNLDSALATYK